MTVQRITVDKIASSVRNLKLTRTLSISDKIDCREGSAIAVRVIGEKSTYNQLEDLHGRWMTLHDGDLVVGVLGNHDWYAGGHRVRRALEDVGLPVLEESAVPVLDGRLWVAGVGDLWERDPDVGRALRGVPEGAATLLLTHNPDVVVDVPAHVPLVLAGHTHGGQIRLLGRGVHRLSERSGNRWSHGWYPRERMYVTAGVGTSTLPLRTVVPEVPVLVLSPA